MNMVRVRLGFGVLLCRYLQLHWFPKIHTEAAQTVKDFDGIGGIKAQPERAEDLVPLLGWRPKNREPGQKVGWSQLEPAVKK